MHAQSIVVVGGSAGGIAALKKVFANFGESASRSAAFLIVVHIAPTQQSSLAKIMARVSGLPAEHPRDGREIEPGRIYIAPPDHHLIVEDSILRVNHGPRENRQRPAINPLFRSAAANYRDRVVGVILSGMLDDGSAGLAEVKQQGGLTIVQDLMDAAYSEMPKHALASTEVDWCVPATEIRDLLLRASEENGLQKLRRTLKKPVRPSTRRVNPFAAKSKNTNTLAAKTLKKNGLPSLFVCPECNGPLWEIKEEGVTHFRCLIGHDLSPETLQTAQGEEVERALSTALRIVEERIELQRRLAQDLHQTGQTLTQKEFLKRAEENLRHAGVIRKLLRTLKT